MFLPYCSIPGCDNRCRDKRPGVWARKIAPLCYKHRPRKDPTMLTVTGIRASCNMILARLESLHDPQELATTCTDYPGEWEAIARAAESVARTARQRAKELNRALDEETTP